MHVKYSRMNVCLMQNLPGILKAVGFVCFHIVFCHLDEIWSVADSLFVVQGLCLHMFRTAHWGATTSIEVLSLKLSKLSNYSSSSHLLSPHNFFSSDVPNGSALTQENISLLSNKAASLSLSEDPEGGGDSQDSQRMGVTPTSAPWSEANVPQNSFCWGVGSFHHVLFQEWLEKPKSNSCSRAAGPEAMCTNTNTRNKSCT